MLGPVGTAIGLIAFLAALVAIGELARRAGMPAPLLLVIVGIGASFLPVVGPVRVTPELILVGLLPPLLYAAAVKTSLIDFRANLRPIGLLSVGLVLFNTVCIGLLAWALLPIPLAAAVALGAVVAPPDAVAATAIARRVGMPRRVVTILEGESLVNDATALVCLRTAIAALAGTLSVGGVIASFAVSVVGGLAAGVLVATVIGFVRRKTLDIFTDMTVSFLTPFLSYLLAEEIGASGFLAVVVTGLLLGHKAPRMLTAQSRVLEQANWATVQFVLENAVFLLIGLQASTIVDDLADSDLGLGRILLISSAILGAVILLRIVWVFPVSYVSRLVPGEGRGDRGPSWQIPALISWAGMRGVVTLAAVFVLPPETPQREALILIALVVGIDSAVAGPPPPARRSRSRPRHPGRGGVVPTGRSARIGRTRQVADRRRATRGGGQAAPSRARAGRCGVGATRGHGRDTQCDLFPAPGTDDRRRTCRGASGQGQRSGA